ncbi:indolepyruvate ferredoxin oxidoreductase family protein [Oceanibacterium hippocampi]|uniref:2-oxoacid ferredoxin oxidoreductase n=1 Tax=Oceanibacterium hippocampi TaxID=745714 RepID=A0A1Y5S1D2_9PROT|nr:indolepyruvate ferredoxin oxidoreductase family protein [Oceanibacterium hippocampi]SLN30412.1 2-oxoacid ferredoxin oxidoreductase [Oceanibacterium hippocampi]
MDIAEPEDRWGTLLDRAYGLDDRYRREHGRVFLTGTQALVRLMLMQRALDRRDGLATAGFVAGYRGSPLGGVDQALWQAAGHLKDHDIRFLPALNEDLAATAVLGSQQVEGARGATADGVFALWYGKGPGVDRAGDALKHGNAFGSSARGGVLAVAGDDHGCVSSSMPHQSDEAMIAFGMPVIHPADVADYLDFGLWGFAASRFSGAWVGFKAISETVESAASVPLKPLPRFALPDGYMPPAGGLNIRWPDLPGPQIEERLFAKREALLAFARANPLDRAVWRPKRARIGIVTVGKAHQDALEALRRLGLDRAGAEAAGIGLYKVGLVWPLEGRGLAEFARGLDTLVVVEEKRGLVERQVKELFYGLPDGERPAVLGKRDRAGKALVPEGGELRPRMLARLLAPVLETALPGIALDRSALADVAHARPTGDGAKRLPYFCPGCPHSTSTRVPEGSEAFAGIGCHFMASWMDRSTTSLIQMGGEGVNWVGKAPFTGDGHVFQNLGDGTYFHSGLLAIRQAIAAGVNITYKILYNDAVAMTGGQPVDGTLSVPAIAAQVRAEGVTRIALVAAEPDKYRARAGLPDGVTIHHRDDLDAVQRELREVRGTSVLIYDQACATELRRKRKRGTVPEAPKRAFINEAVCEGCGDCTVQSNCLAVQPVETPLGRKRQIDQAACNVDLSCLKGFCPSFVTVEGARLRKPAAAEIDPALFAALPVPAARGLDRPWEILVAGVGGTGIVTIGALIAMAAHLEGKGARVLDFTGFAQKGGAVLSHVRLGADPAALHQARIDEGAADLVIAADLVVASDRAALATCRPGATRIVAHSAEIPTAEMLRNPTARVDVDGRLAALEAATGKGRVSAVAAGRLAHRLMGDPVFANVMLLGHAFQQGLVPVSEAALDRAIELNGVATADNARAFAWGRLMAHDPDAVLRAAGIEAAPVAEDAAAMIARRAASLADYQDAAYADRYRAFMARVAAAEKAEQPGGEALTRAVAQGLYRLMAYKDEYEVARLMTDGRLEASLRDRFEDDYRLAFHMAPPLLSRRRDALGRPAKMAFGRWLLPAMTLLAKGRRLRGTAFDPFGRSAERRMERALIGEYRAIVEGLLADLSPDSHARAVEIAGLADEIRGYGPVKEANVARVRARWAELLTVNAAPRRAA